MHYYQHNIKTFNSATRYLTRVERALYRDLIEIYYDTEKPLISNIDRLSRLVMANSDDEKEALNYVLSEFFVLSDGSYRHDYCDETIESYHTNKSAKSKAGIASAEARKAKSKQRQSTPVGQTLNKYSTNKEPRTKNQEPEREKKKRFSPPTEEEVTAFLISLNWPTDNGATARAMIDYYAQQGWKLANGNMMKDWNAAARGWLRNQQKWDAKK